MLIKWSGKASAEKAWLLYEFPFRLNPGDKPNDAQTWKNYSSLYTEDQFQANSEKKMMGHFRGSKIKPTKYYLVATQKIVNMKALYEEHSSKTYIYWTTASGLSYELGVNGVKKVNGNWNIINKNVHSTFHTGVSQCQKNCYAY